MLYCLVKLLWPLAAIRGYALSYLSSCAGRIRFLLGSPGMVALDLDATLKKLFQQIVQHLENIPKPQGETISAITCNLSVSNFRHQCFIISSISEICIVLYLYDQVFISIEFVTLASVMCLAARFSCFICFISLGAAIFLHLMAKVRSAPIIGFSTRWFFPSICFNGLYLYEF